MTAFAFQKYFEYVTDVTQIQLFSLVDEAFRAGAAVSHVHLWRGPQRNYHRARFNVLGALFGLSRRIGRYKRPLEKL